MLDDSLLSGLLELIVPILFLFSVRYFSLSCERGLIVEKGEGNAHLTKLYVLDDSSRLVVKIILE